MILNGHVFLRSSSLRLNILSRTYIETSRCALTSRLCVTRYSTPNRSQGYSSKVPKAIDAQPLPYRSAGRLERVGGPENEFGERLLIYRSGTMKTTFIAWNKLTTVFVFAFSCLAVAPRFVFSPDDPSWMALAAITCGAIPMLLVSSATGPFVNAVHLRLPLHARRSVEALNKYVSNLPKDAELQIITLRLSGFQKTSSASLHNLRSLPRRKLSLANFEKIEKGSKTVGGWKRLIFFASKSRNKFYVDLKDKKALMNSRAAGVWPHVWKAIEANN